MKEETKKYTITCTENQMRLIAESLEMYSRMICGQLNETFLPPIRSRIFNLLDVDKDFSKKRNIIDENFSNIKKILWPELDKHSAYGIGYSEDSDLGYEMYKEILFQFEKEKQEKCEKNNEKYYWNVHSYENTLKLTKEPKIKIKKLKH